MLWEYTSKLQYILWKFIYISVISYYIKQIVWRIILYMNAKNFNHQGKPRKIFIISAQEIHNMKAAVPGFS